jgi:ribosomal protein S2
MKKNLVEFSLNQLLDCNLHIGFFKQNWNSLINLFVIGYRLDNFILDINVGIVNLKKSLLLIETFSFKQKQILFFFENKLFLSNLFFYRKYFYKFNINFLIIKYLAGIVTNFKNFRLKVYPKIRKFLKLINQENLDNFFFLKKKFFRLFGLFNYNSVPASVISLDNNNNLCNEALLVGIPSIQIMDAFTQEQAINKITYLIPFNLNNAISMILIFNLFLKSIIIGYIRKKKLFFKFINFLLQYYESKFVLSNLTKLLQINFSFICNFYKFTKFNIQIKNNQTTLKSLLLKKYFIYSKFKMKKKYI